MDIPSKDQDTFDRFVAELESAEAADQEAALSSWDSLLMWVKVNVPGAMSLLSQLAMTAPALLQSLANLIR